MPSRAFAARESGDSKPTCVRNEMMKSRENHPRPQAHHSPQANITREAHITFHAVEHIIRRRRTSRPQAHHSPQANITRETHITFHAVEHITRRRRTSARRHITRRRRTSRVKRTSRSTQWNTSLAAGELLPLPACTADEKEDMIPTHIKNMKNLKKDILPRFSFEQAGQNARFVFQIALR